MQQKNSPVGGLRSLRGNHKLRLWVIAILMAIVVILFIFVEKMRWLLVIAFVALLAAFGLETTMNDWDVGRLMETGSFSESRLGRDSSGNVLYDVFGDVTADAAKGKKADAYNCDDFSTQPEAQSFFEKVGGRGNDLNRLDGDKDGEACESLRKG